MCGINGLYGEINTDISSKIIEKMNASMVHRGPDDNGVYAEENMALGHQRLSILDLSSLGKQPMVSHNGRYIVSFNGEIYNFAELKSKLKFQDFKTLTDTEMILAAFEEWGTDCLQRFNGMFALAIYDKQKKELYLARDRMGIKPLYYYKNDGKFLFSSEIRSLLASGMVPRKLNKPYLSEFLEYQTVHTPNTLIQDVYMLKAGHWMIVTDKVTPIIPYWRIRDFAEVQISPSREMAEKKVKEIFFESVERRMIADVPLGAFLSGGIDSSAIVAAMSTMSNTAISTFNVSFAEKEYSEAKYAKEIADLYKTNHHEIHLSPKDFLEELPFAMDAMDHPSGDGPNSYVVSKATKEAGITVALSGLGGDELFCGYDVFPLLNKMEESPIRHLPRSIRSSIGNMIFAFKKGNNTLKLKQLLEAKKVDFRYAYPLFRQTLWKEEIENILGTYTPDSVKGFLVPGYPDLYTKISVAEIRSYMQNTLLRDTDQMSMASSLEVRVPFLDHNLVEYAISLRGFLKHPTTPKKLLVDAMGDLIPRSIWDRKKMGFTLPWKTWMKNELKDFCQEGIEVFKGIDGVHGESVDAIWNNFLMDKPLYTWTRVWPIVVLGNWIKKNQIE